MPFFFLMAGAASWFSLRRRTAGRYVRERVTRLLLPFILGAIVLTPIQAYYELTHKGWGARVMPDRYGQSFEIFYQLG